MAKKISLFCAKPEELNADSLLMYKELTTRYPYCQYAQLMFLLNLKQTGDAETFSSTLPFTAISVPDRARLKQQVQVNAQKSPRVPQNKGHFSPFQDSLPRRKEEGFSPRSEALPRSSNPRPKAEVLPRSGNPAPAAGFRPVTEEPVDRLRNFLRPQQAEGQARPSTNRRQADAIIDRFMQGQEHLISLNEGFDYARFDPDTGGSNREDFSVGSETLAEMYLKNGAPEKAIAVYESLGLKFPEKSSYFANLIRRVRKEYSIK